jgi:hypothetical protein
MVVSRSASQQQVGGLVHRLSTAEMKLRIWKLQETLKIRAAAAARWCRPAYGP